MRQTVSHLLQMYPSDININILTKYYYYLYCFNTSLRSWRDCQREQSFDIGTAKLSGNWGGDALKFSRLQRSLLIALSSAGASLYRREAGGREKESARGTTHQLFLNYRCILIGIQSESVCGGDSSRSKAARMAVPPSNL